jgi:hypothetical protein
MKRIVVGALLFYAGVAAILFWFSVAEVKAAEPLPLPSPWPSQSTPPIVHSCGIRCHEPTVVGLPLPTPQPKAAADDLPDTDTDIGPGVTVITIWVVAILVILVAWWRLAYHDE